MKTLEEATSGELELVCLRRAICKHAANIAATRAQLEQMVKNQNARVAEYVKQVSADGKI